MKPSSVRRYTSATLLWLASVSLPAQVSAVAHLRVSPTRTGGASAPAPPAVLWLQPLDAGQHLPPAFTGPFTLQQKNRSFVPHLLVVPVGATVNFPNGDPFFHNVFSLYNGKRFDLGLYESGTNRQVVFNREGASYIFCNIHPEMSAVVLALDTPLWARSDATGTLRITGIPPGNYEAHLWVEGTDSAELNRWTRRVTLSSGMSDVGTLTISPTKRAHDHLNKFGQPYVAEAPIY